MKTRCLGLTLLALSPSLTAHPDIQLPSPSWCSGANQGTTIVGMFSFSETEISAMKACLLDPNNCNAESFAAPLKSIDEQTSNKRPNTCNKTRAADSDRQIESRLDCGNVNDDWTAAKTLAVNACHGYQIPGGPGDVGTVIFLARSETFNLPGDDHHDAYLATEGLSISCVRCVEVLPSH